MDLLFIDIETRNQVKISDGIEKYTKHASAEMLCCAYAFNDEDVKIWTPKDTVPERVKKHINSGHRVIAHNAMFEKWALHHIGCRYGWPSVSLKQLVCTMAIAYANGLPGSLDAATRLLREPTVSLKDVQKQSEIRVLFHPLKDGSWKEDDELFAKLYSYCMSDVEAHRGLYNALGPLSGKEQRIWELCQTINERGVFVDIETAIIAKKIKERSTERDNAEIENITQGIVKKGTQTKALLLWLAQEGLVLENLRAETVKALLSANTDGQLSSPIQRILELRLATSRSSTAKIDSILSKVGDDGRMRFNFQYHAAHTGRWGGRGAQLQNLPRGHIKKQSVIEQLIDDLSNGIDDEAIEEEYGLAASAAISSIIRSLVCSAPHKDLIASDYASIESRVLAWVSGEEWVLNAIQNFDQNAGPDLYVVTASIVFGVSLEEAKEKRLLGKIAELSLGYGGGLNAFARQAKSAGVVLEEPHIRALIRSWRKKRPQTAELWEKAQKAAVYAFLNRRRVGFGSAEGRCFFERHHDGLQLRLPSGRHLHYRNVEIVLDKHRKNTISYEGISSQTKQVTRIETYGARIIENICQAIARDILAEGLLRLDTLGYDIIMHVHDEAVVEVEESDPTTPEDISNILACRPDWAPSIPLAAHGWRGKRHRKD